jgi:hypothetical protein
MKNPKRPSEWQEAVDAAHGALALESARAYGLVTGGPKVNTGRCADILQRGRALGYRPRPEAIECFIRSLADHLHK